MKILIYLFFGLFITGSNAQNFNSILQVNNYKIVELRKSLPANTKLITAKISKKRDSLKIEKKYKELPKKQFETYSNLTLPLEKLRITSNYGMRFHPIKKQWLFHSGIDFKAKNDTIKALFNGVIEDSGYQKGLGYFIKVRHGDFVITYGHLSEYFLLKNTPVLGSTHLGITGNTGISTSQHLHFSVAFKNKYIDPKDFLADLIFIDKNIQTLKKNNNEQQ
jgi:murein DD-endopeptidase MepM/ murein hydrolase activator NlpD